MLAVRFHFVDGVDVEWMHVICLGIVNSLIEKRLYSSSETYFIGDKVNSVDLLTWHWVGSYVCFLFRFQS